MKITSLLKRRYDTLGVWRERCCSMVNDVLEVADIKNVVEFQCSLNHSKLLSYHNENLIISLEDLKEGRAVSLMFSNNKTFKIWYDYLFPYLNKIKLNSFNFLKQLGSGYFGKVKLVEHIDSKQVFAIKSMKKKYLIDEDKFEIAKTEKEIMQMINHPFVVEIKFAFQDAGKFYIGMEYIHGGQLFSLVQNKIHLSLVQLRFYISEIALALAYVHSCGIVYRDLKLENVLVCEDGHIKISDYGLSKVIKKQRKTQSFCGTWEYIPPEMIKDKKYGFEVDWWALGVLIYELAFFVTPFKGPNEKVTMENIVKKEPYFPPGTPEIAVSLMKGLLNKNQKKRMMWKDIKAHPFFECIDWKAVREKKLQPPFVPGRFQIPSVSIPLIERESSAEPCGMFNVEGFEYNSFFEGAQAIIAA